GLEVGGVRGLDGGQAGGDGVGHGGHGGGAVPQVGVRRAGGQAEQVLDHDDLAGRARHRVLDRVHELVVAGAVLHHELGLVQQAADRGAGLERVRIGVRVAQDGGDQDVL